MRKTPRSINLDLDYDPDFDDFDEPEDAEQDNIVHIVMQLLVGIDVNSDHEVRFSNGTSAVIPLADIQAFLTKYYNLKPADKSRMQELASRSKKGFYRALALNGETRPTEVTYTARSRSGGPTQYG